MSADQDERPGRDKEMCRAIGRYVIEFSQLVLFMREMLARGLSPDRPYFVELALGQMPATGLADAFFAVCQESGNLSADEKKIGRSLRARVLKEANENRNDFAHGDWWVPGRLQSVEEGPSRLDRIKPAKEAEAFIHTPMEAKDVDALSDAVVELRELVTAYGIRALALRSQADRVSDILELRDKRVVRRDMPRQQPPSSSSSSQ